MEALTEKVDLNKKKALAIIARARSHGDLGTVIYHLFALTQALEQLIGPDEFKDVVKIIFDQKLKENE